MYGLDVWMVAFGWLLALTGMRFPGCLRVDMSQNAPERRAHAVPSAKSRHLKAMVRWYLDGEWRGSVTGESISSIVATRRGVQRRGDIGVRDLRV
jgi:hypothetical protein